MWTGLVCKSYMTSIEVHFVTKNILIQMLEITKHFNLLPCISGCSKLRLDDILLLFLATLLPSDFNPPPLGEAPPPYFFLPVYGNLDVHSYVSP